MTNIIYGEANQVNNCAIVGIDHASRNVTLFMPYNKAVQMIKLLQPTQLYRDREVEIHGIIRLKTVD